MRVATAPAGRMQREGTGRNRSAAVSLEAALPAADSRAGSSRVSIPRWAPFTCQGTGVCHTSASGPHHRPEALQSSRVPVLRPLVWTCHLHGRRSR